MRAWCNVAQMSSRHKIPARNRTPAPFPNEKGDVVLVIKAFVNYDKIDEIHIQNVARCEKGIREYKIRKPKCDESIFHERKLGWRLLAVKALQVLERNNTISDEDNIRK